MKPVVHHPLITLTLGGLILSLPMGSVASDKQTPWQSKLNEHLNGQWQQEWAGDRRESQKMEAQLQLEWEQDFTDGWLAQTSLTAIARLRLDAEGLLTDGSTRQTYSSASEPWINNRHSQLELREFYLDAEWWNLYWRLGKQQVVWGQADGLKVLDVVTPQSYREFILDDFDDSRIPLWMVNVEWLTSDSSSLQFLWIPDTSYHDLAQGDNPYTVTSPLRVPSPSNIQQAVDGVTTDQPRKPNHWLKDSDAGVRYSQFWRGWDLTLNYFYHYRDFYVPYQAIEANTDVTTAPASGTVLHVQPRYQRSHLIGGTASNAFGNLTLRTEIGWYSHSHHIAEYSANNQGIESSPELSSVIGLDWQGFSDTLISVQWFQSLLLDYDRRMIRDHNEQTLSLLLERKLANDTWTLKLQGLYSLNHQDQLWRPKISYLWRSNVELWLGADVFSGTSKGLYGQFDNNDRVVVGFEWGF
ncbi:hypothetical protein G8770_08955 [Aestuariicella hydrocarbonica]|uniref:Uncharacterized protein n=1 Tax=Pseudomaricurvus hydrocarbonicus TaxID=1470433 RepID=A0A9E5JU71_9GAMM|nr:DUF1302 family protein [Aestuariicella hydrocarbonica]NHO65668.1 hypothetical protein [Aestuariicella hydrocarbonica]